MKSTYYLMAVFAFVNFSCQTQDTNSNETPAEDEVLASSIEGAWEITSMTNSDGEEESPYRSIFIYTDNFYSAEIAIEERPSWPEIPEGEERASEHIINAYEGLISNSGRYRIEGDSLIHEIIVAKSPNFMNDNPRSAVSFLLEGDNLTTTGNRWTTRFKRLK